MRTVGQNIDLFVKLSQVGSSSIRTVQQLISRKTKFLLLNSDGPRDPPNIENAPGGCDQGWWEYHGTCYRSFGSNLTGRPETHSVSFAFDWLISTMRYLE